MTAAHSAETLQPAPALQLLVELPSWPRVFLGNLRDLVFPRSLPRLDLRSAPAPFWPDVFVKRELPWFGFLQSVACHAAAFLFLVEIAAFFALQPQSVPRPVFDHSQVIYYSATDYLPPLDTRATSANSVPADPPKLPAPQTDQPQKADPEFSRQPIISLPPEADNRKQTIVTPPNVKLQRDLALPNIVKWSDQVQKPRLAIPATPLTPAAELSRLASPTLPVSVVAPPPSIETTSNQLAIRNIGDLNIGHTSVIAPAPQLPVGEQSAGRSSAVSAASQVVPPPPSLVESSGTSGRIIALNLHPALDAPPDPPAGNRRSAFTATPEGHAGASGSAGSSSGSNTGIHNERGSVANRKGNDNVPTGLYVGKAPASAKTSAVGGDPTATANATNQNLAASTRSPHASTNPAPALQPESTAKLAEAERAVFVGRRFYSLALNLPNLNSAGGSWVVHFTELHADPNSSAELSPPVATRHVDPGYPMQLMRENVAGTVILYAIIHADGTVGDVRVLRSVDPRLDQRASDAVAQWQFQPATKNGSPVDVEATFQIPFRPSRLNGF